MKDDVEQIAEISFGSKINLREKKVDRSNCLPSKLAQQSYNKDTSLP
jgi:hypothetical protein